MTITRLEPISMIYSRDTDPVSRVINAIWANDWDDMKSIINEHPNCVNGTTWDNETALSLCVEYTEGAIYLIDHGANINSRSIYIAVMKNSVEVLKYMLAKLGPNNDIIYRHRNDVNKICNLNRAAYDGHVEIIKVLLDYGMDIHEGTSVRSNRYPITEAAWMDKTECVKYLVECGADINQQGMDADHSVLSLAVENNNVELVEFLVEKGADVNIKDMFGRPPLYHATVKGYPNLITYLADNGADVNVIIPCLDDNYDDDGDDDDDDDETVINETVINETVIDETVIDETTLMEFHNKKLLDGEFEASHYTTNDEDNLIYESYTIYLVKNVIQQNKYKYKIKDWIAEWWINLYQTTYDPTSRHPPDNRFWQEMCENPLAAFLFNNTIHLRHLMNSTQECDFEEKTAFGELQDLFVKMHEEEDTKYIQWFKLAHNPHPSAIRLIERNMDKLEDEDSSDAGCFCLKDLCYNPNAIHIIEQHIDKLNDKEWYTLCSNPNAISLLEKFPEKINWGQLCLNPNAIHMIEPNLDKLCYSSWCNLCRNPNAISIIEEYIDKLNDTNWIIQINAEHGESLQHFIPLCENPKAVHIIEKHLDKLYPKCWEKLCDNPNAMYIIEQHIEKVDYGCLLTLCGNSNAMHIIEHLIDIKQLDQWCWNSLCDNTSALPFLEQNPDKLHENILSNPSIFELSSNYSNNVDE